MNYRSLLQSNRTLATQNPIKTELKLKPTFVSLLMQSCVVHHSFKHRSRFNVQCFYYNVPVNLPQDGSV